MTEPTSSNYPSALDSNTTLGGDAVNLTSLTLDTSMDASTQTVSVTEDITGVNVPCYLLIGSELIYATAKSSGNFINCDRGAGSTSAASHTNGDTVYVVYAANLFNQLKRAIVAIETELGTDPAGSSTDVKTRLATVLGGTGNLDFPTSTELTISSGSVTVTQNWHTIDTESDAATDDLDTIVASGVTDGFLLLIRANNTARTVVVKHGTGNIQMVNAADIVLDETYKYAILIYDATLATWLAISISNNTREIITANRTYYVRTDGSDSNTGLANTAGGAFLTIQKAIDVVATIDRGTYSVTIQVGTGTYSISTTAIQLREGIGSGIIYITGDTTTPANVIISAGAIASPDAAITANGISTRYEIKGFQFNGSSTYAAIGARYGSFINFGNCTFNTGFTYHLESTFGASIVCVANYTISGGATAHMSCRAFSGIRVQVFTVTVSGTPAFSTGFCETRYCGVVFANGNTYSGSATGPRYLVDLNGVIQTAGGGASYFPGNSAGSSATGGQYA